MYCSSSLSLDAEEEFADMPVLFPQANFTEEVANCIFVLPKTSENLAKNSTRRSDRIKHKLDISLGKSPPSFGPLSMTKRKNTKPREILIRDIRFSTKCSKSYNKVMPNGEIVHIISIAPMSSEPRLPNFRKTRVQSITVSSTTMDVPPSSASIGIQTEMLESNEPPFEEFFPFMGDGEMLNLIEDVSNDINFWNPDFVPCFGNCNSCLICDPIVSSAANASGEEITKNSEMDHKNSVVFGEDTTQKEVNSQIDSSLVTITQIEGGAVEYKTSVPQLDVTEEKGDMNLFKTSNLQFADSDKIFDESGNDDIMFIERKQKKQEPDKDSEVIFEKAIVIVNLDDNDDILVEKEIICLD